MKPNSPRRPRGDYFTSRPFNPDEIACDYACLPFRRWIDWADAKWGIGRLPELVAPDVAAKYGALIGKLNEAYEDVCVEECIRIAAAGCRAIPAMDAAATEAGHPGADPGIIEYETELGFKFGIMVDPRAYLGAPKALYPVYSLHEVALALQARGADHSMVLAAKAAGGQVTNWDRQTAEAPAEPDREVAGVTPAGTAHDVNGEVIDHNVDDEQADFDRAVDGLGLDDEIPF